MECITCGQYFTNEYDLMSHMRDSHTTMPSNTANYNSITGQGELDTSGNEDESVPHSYNPITGQGSY